jgi:transposase
MKIASERRRMMRLQGSRRHLDGIMEAIRTEINSAVVEGLNNKIRAAFKRSYGFKAQEYRDTIIYLVASGLKLPPEC